MFKVIALAVAIAATTSVAGAQGAAVAKSTVKTGTMAKRHRTVKKEESQTELMKEAKVSDETARATALKEVAAGSSIKSGEIERENGKLIYSYDITVPGKAGIDEVNVNALTGAVVGKVQHEGPKTVKKEAVQEAKEKKTK
ncbi:MAG: PepSY domain-containing protein [Gemmatimonadaceae bacterium]